MMNENVVKAIGSSIEQVLEIDKGGNKVVWGRYLQVRVLINVHTALKRGTKVTISGGGQALAVFKYERLPDFCFVCGKLDHQENECDEAVKAMKLYGGVSREYSPWLKVEGQHPKVGCIGFLSKNEILEGGGKQLGVGRPTNRSEERMAGYPSMAIGGSRRIEDEGNVDRGKGVITENCVGGAIFQMVKSLH